MSAATSADGRQYWIRPLQSGDEARWDAFVEAAPDGTFYHLSGWRRILEDTLGHRTWYLCCEADGEIVGVLPLAQVKSVLFGNSLISLPFLVYGGPLAADREAARALVEEAVQLAESLNVDSLEFRNRAPTGFDGDLQNWAVKSSYVTFRKQISPDPDENLRAVPRKQRAMIRKGIKAGLQVEEDTDASRLYTALLECKRNLGTPFFGQSYLQAVKDTFQERAEILTVTRGTDVVCSVLSFRFRDEILPYYGGGGRLARDCYGNDFMYWAVMERAAESGIRVFDYGRSTEGTGSYRFKKHWGFEPTPLHYQNYLVRATETPNLSPSNPKYRLLINTWKRLPLPLAGALGPPLARRLG